MNYLLWSLLGPASWHVWLVLLTAAALVFERWTLARRAALLAATVVIALQVLPTGFWMMERLESRYPTPAEVPADVSDIVVLAGAERLFASSASGRIEFNQHGERVAEALALAHRLPRAKLWIVGGVSRATGARDVDWTLDFWRRAGIPAARTDIIAGTFDTCGNAHGIAGRLPGRRVLLVTSGFHMQRAMACMQAAGVDAIAYAVDRQGWSAPSLADAFSRDLTANLDRADLALHEYVGIAYYRLTGRID